MGGGLAGHNGLRSVAQHLGTPDFLRLRIGVGRPERGDPRPLADYVLADFEPHEDPDRLVAAAADAVETLDAEGLEAVQRAINGRRYVADRTRSSRRARTRANRARAGGLRRTP